MNQLLRKLLPHLLTILLGASGGAVGAEIRDVVLGVCTAIIPAK